MSSFIFNKHQDSGLPPGGFFEGHMPDIPVRYKRISSAKLNYLKTIIFTDEQPFYNDKLIGPLLALKIASDILYSNLEPIEDNDKKSLQHKMLLLLAYYIKVKKNNIDPNVYFNIGICMFYNINNDKDLEDTFKHSVKYFNLALENGIFCAFYYIAIMNAYGLGMEINEKTSFLSLEKYISIANDKNFTVSPYVYLELALHHYKLYELKKCKYELNTALSYFLESNKGLEFSLYFISIIYCNLGKTKEAQEYFNKAILLSTIKYPKLYIMMIDYFDFNNQFSVSYALLYYKHADFIGIKEAKPKLAVLYPNILKSLECKTCINCWITSKRKVLILYNESRSHKNNVCNCQDICYCMWLIKFLITYYLKPFKSAKKQKKNKYNLGNLYLLVKKYKEAFNAYLDSSDYPPSQYQLFWFYYKGKGVEKDKKLAVEYLKKAANNGFDKAVELYAKF